jgi:hypothetical protein
VIGIPRADALFRFAPSTTGANGFSANAKTTAWEESWLRLMVV